MQMLGRDADKGRETTLWPLLVIQLNTGMPFYANSFQTPLQPCYGCQQ